MSPLSIHNASSGMRKLGVLQGLMQGFGYPSSSLPSAASWEATPLGWQRDTQMCWRAGNCWPVQTTPGFPALWGSRQSSFPSLMLALGFPKLALHTAFFWSWLLSQACLKLFSEFNCEVWLALLLIHLLIRLSLGKGSKIRCCTGLGHLLLVLKHLSPT